MAMGYQAVAQMIRDGFDAQGAVVSARVAASVDAWRDFAAERAGDECPVCSCDHLRMSSYGTCLECDESCSCDEDCAEHDCPIHGECTCEEVVWSVSLCEDDGSEICCLGSYKDEGAAWERAKDEARERGLPAKLMPAWPWEVAKVPT